jgi:hypothetical protein
MEANTEVFGDKTETEHKLVYTALHRELISLIEASISSTIDHHSYSLNDFYNICRSAESQDAGVKMCAKTCTSLRIFPWNSIDVDRIVTRARVQVYRFSSNRFRLSFICRPHARS